MFSDIKGIKLENNNRKVSGKIPKYFELNNILLNKPCVKGEIKRKIRNQFELS